MASVPFRRGTGLPDQKDQCLHAGNGTPKGGARAGHGWAERTAAQSGHAPALWRQQSACQHTALHARGHHERDGVRPCHQPRRGCERPGAHEQAEDRGRSNRLHIMEHPESGRGCEHDGTCEERSAQQGGKLRGRTERTGHAGRSELLLPVPGRQGQQRCGLRP